MQPTEKGPQIDQLLNDLTGKDRVQTIQADQCTTCDRPIGEFTDDLSLKEYKISGMCQRCQDEFFNQPKEEPEYPEDLEDFV